jgi:hypothetical protein
MDFLSFVSYISTCTSANLTRLQDGTLALLEAIAVAIHFEDVDVVCQPVEQRARQAARTRTRRSIRSNGRLEVTMVEPRS